MLTSLARFGLLAVAVLLFVTSCAASDDQPSGTPGGDASIVTQAVGEFDSVLAQDGIVLHVRFVEPSETKGTIEIAGDEVSRNGISLAVEDRRLVIAAEDDTVAMDSVVVTAEVGDLQRLTVINGARAVLQGVVDRVELEARSGRLDAEDLAARQLVVELEQSSATVCASDSVSGYSIYGSRLTARCGGDTSAVRTANGGEVVVEAPS